MSRLHKKAQARTKQMVGRKIGDDQLVQEGKGEERRADNEDAGEPRRVEGKREE